MTHKIQTMILHISVILLFVIATVTRVTGDEVITSEWDGSTIPDYNGMVSIDLGNTDLDAVSPGLSFSELDDYGRCGPAEALIGPETLTSEARGSIGDIKPSGWKQQKYPGIVDSEPPYLYNRCHLVAHMFYGNTSNDARNLITGTRYFNTEGMLPYELQVVHYVEDTGDQVRYRVTPFYDGDKLLAKGVVMEAESLMPEGLQFCVFVYNIQPGISIDYRTGDSWVGEAGNLTSSDDQSPSDEEITYIGNKNTHVFHLPSCDSVYEMKDKNKKYLSGERDTVIAEGWKPCGRCHP